MRPAEGRERAGRLLPTCACFGLTVLSQELLLSNSIWGHGFSLSMTGGRKDTDVGANSSVLHLIAGGETGPGDASYPGSQSQSEAWLRPGLGFLSPAGTLSVEDSGTEVNSKCQLFFPEPITPAQYQYIECADWSLGADSSTTSISHLLSGTGVFL